MHTVPNGRLQPLYRCSIFSFSRTMTFMCPLLFIYKPWCTAVEHFVLKRNDTPLTKTTTNFFCTSTYVTSYLRKPCRSQLIVVHIVGDTASLLACPSFPMSSWNYQHGRFSGIAHTIAMLMYFMKQTGAKMLCDNQPGKHQKHIHHQKVIHRRGTCPRGKPRNHRQKS